MVEVEQGNDVEKAKGIVTSDNEHTMTGDAYRHSRNSAFEYAMYAVVVGVCFAILVQRGCQYSNSFGPGGAWEGQAPKLQQGWIFGRLVDVSDSQWRSFRTTLPALTIFFLLFGIGSRSFRTPSHRVYYILVWACLMVAYLHGGRAIHVIFLVSINWIWAQIVVNRPLASWKKVGSVWVLNCMILLCVRMTEGFQFLDRYLPFLAIKGSFRWEICYNLTMLRMVSYSLDYIWATGDGKYQWDRNSHSRKRPLPSRDLYGYLYCVAHALYPPLYISGPIITYNDFVRQIVAGSDDGASQHVDQSNPARKGTSAHHVVQPGIKVVAVYACRFILDVLVIEIMTHYLYFNSIATHRLGPKLQLKGLEYSALDVATTGWWVLAFTWLKFTVIWRFFRLAALIEGIEPPENMKKCFAMNYDVQGFWKNWHASFNQWLVQYMYIPLGGSKSQMLMIWPIFFFVAIWHDIEWKLIGWASLMCLAFLPEIIIKREFNTCRWDWLRQKPQMLEILQGILATINIAALMCGNMVGFVVGLDGLVPLLSQMMASPFLVIVSLTSFYCAARLMFAFEAYKKLKSR